MAARTPPLPGVSVTREEPAVLPVGSIRSTSASPPLDQSALDVARGSSTTVQTAGVSGADHPNAACTKIDGSLPLALNVSRAFDTARASAVAAALPALSADESAGVVAVLAARYPRRARICTPGRL